MKSIYAVGVIFENELGQILVLKRNPQDPEGKLWGLVGGKIESGENATSAAQREIQEEIGQVIDSKKLILLKAYAWARNDTTIHFTAFTISIQAINSEIRLDPKEHTAYMWETPTLLHQRPDLMAGMYPILEDAYRLG